jgi:hypothetical protein
MAAIGPRTGGSASDRARAVPCLGCTKSAIGSGPTKLLRLTFRDLGRDGLVIRTADVVGQSFLLIETELLQVRTFCAPTRRPDLVVSAG